jgi:hypothetical protein
LQEMATLIVNFNVLVLSLIASIAIAADLTAGLVGYWPLDGDAKDTIDGKDGKLVGGAKWAKDGYLGGAVECDGSTGYVEVSGFNLTTDTITAVAWINGWRQSAWTGIVVGRGGTPFWMGFTDQDTLSYVWNNNAGDTWGWRQGPKIPQEEWAMAAMAIEPKKATAYIYSDDKLDQGVNAIAHIEQTVEMLKFGWDECCGAERHFLGHIDEVMIYDRALSEDDILQLATSGLAVSTAGKRTITWSAIKSQ